MDNVEGFLARYGVKGMKWGQHKKHEANIQKLTSNLAKAENKMADVHNRESFKNQDSGMGGRASFKKAADHKDVKKAAREVEKADDALRKAHRDRKEEIHNERKKTDQRFKDAYTKESGRGYRWASAFVAENLAVGYNYQRAAGYTEGQTLATTMIAGPLGNVVAAETAARRAITED